MTINEGVNEMRCIMANTTLNVCRGELHEVGEVEHLEATLAEDDISYRESVGDVGSSTSVLGPSTCDPCPSMS
jgi:hypothetical protein